MDNTTKIYCIYNAQGSITGELRYLYNKYIKNIKCSMCDITHNSFTEKSEWKKKCSKFPLDIECLHLDELPNDIRILVSNKAPCVVAQTNSVNKIILKNDELIRMNGNIEFFFSRLHEVTNN